MAKRTGNIARPADIYADGRARRGRSATRSSRPTTARRSTSATSPWPPRRRPSSASRRLLAALDAYREDARRRCRRSTPCSRTRGAFTAALDDDLNVVAGAGAPSSTWSASSTGGWTPGRCRPPTPRARPRFLRDLDRVLGGRRGGRRRPRAGARGAARGARGRAGGARLGGVRPAARRARRARHRVEDTRDGQRWRRLTVTDDARR